MTRGEEVVVVVVGPEDPWAIKSTVQVVVVV